MRKILTDIAFLSTNKDILILIPKQEGFDLSECSADIISTDVVLFSANKEQELILSISAKNADWVNKIVIKNEFMIAGIEGDDLENVGDCYRIVLND